MSTHCQSKPSTYTKLVVNLVCAFVHVPICDLALCLLSSLLPPFSFPLYFLMLFATSLAIVQHSNLSVSLLINPNDVSCRVFSLFDLICVLVNRNFRSFHSIAFGATTFIKRIRALRTPCPGHLFILMSDQLPTFEGCVRAGVHTQRPQLEPLRSTALCQCRLALAGRASGTIMWTAAALKLLEINPSPGPLSADDHLVL